jgi:phospholipid transport system transporter-binding protein
VFDLAGVSSADSAALAVIIGWQRAAGLGRVRLTNLPQSIRSLAELYSIADLLPALSA